MNADADLPGVAEGGASVQDWLNSLFSWESLARLGLALLVIVAGILVSRLVGRLVAAALRKGDVARDERAVERVVRYALYAVVGVNALSIAGVDVSALLGAAGIAGIAIGFAAQTSVSNLISGLFLLWEKPFQAGDVLAIDAINGEVETIDLLATRIRTFDNQVVRVPNETMIKANIVNVTRYPIRRLNIPLTVSYDTPLETVRLALMEVAAGNRWCLDNPEPFFLVDRLDRDGMSILFGVWFEKNDIVALKNSIMSEIQRRFADEGIRLAAARFELATDAKIAASDGKNPGKTRKTAGKPRG